MKITDDGEKECKILKKFVIFYFTIFRKTVTDLVPKTIMHFLINSVLFDEIYSTSGSEELLNESKEITLNREAAQNMLDVSCSRRNILISFWANFLHRRSTEPTTSLTRSAVEVRVSEPVYLPAVRALVEPEPQVLPEPKRSQSLQMRSDMALQFS